MSILSVYREPFACAPRVAWLDEGMTLDQLWRKMPDLPPEFADVGGLITINGHPVPRENWARYKPKSVSRDGVPVQVAFHLPIHGGGDDGGKSGIATIGALALLFLSGGAAGGLFATSSGLFAAGSLSSNLLAAGISLVGQLALSGLAKPPTKQKRERQSNEAGISGNVLEPNGPIPRVLGERRVFPVMVTQPLITLDGDDEIVEAVFALAGPHRLQNIRIGSAAIESIAGVQFETRDGTPGQAPLRLVQRYGRSEDAQRELRGHRLQPDDMSLLDDGVDPALAIPQPAVFSTPYAPDSYELQVAFPQGLHRPASAGDRLRVPFRLRIREFGGAWRNLPELHFVSSESRLIRATIRFVWSPIPLAIAAASTAGWVEVRTQSNGQTVAPSSEAWAADAEFYSGSGDTYMWSNNLGATGVQNIATTADTVTIRLDPVEFPPARYEVEIVRGFAMRDATYARAGYTVNSVARDFFWYSGTPSGIAVSREGLTETVAVLRAAAVINSPPVLADDCALIAVKARNVQLDELSVLAGGYVKDWNGSAWTGQVITSNPAPHLRAVYADRPNLDPVPVASMDDATLVEWRQRCIDLAYTCNAVVVDASVEGAATVAAGCGYARPYMSDVFGVVQDYDRSAEAPVMVLSPRNSRGFSEARAYPRLPTGLRVTFDDAANDWQPKQIMVWRRGIEGDSSRTEQVRLEGIDTEAKAIAMARYMMDVAEARAAAYSLDVPPSAALVARAGALVVVSNDTLSQHHGYGRVIAGGTAGVVLDTKVRLVNEPHVDDVADFDAVPDVDILGLVSAAAIQREDHTVDVAMLNCTSGETDVLTFAVAQDRVIEGDKIVVGPGVAHQLRLIVQSVAPSPGLEAKMTLIDEASEVFA